jgi:hypothetical protein
MLRHSYLSDLNECAPVVEITQMNQLFGLDYRRWKKYIQCTVY